MFEGRNILYGIKLRQLRALNNFTQKECIDALKLKRQQDLSDLENGKKQFTNALISDICKHFKITYSGFTNLQVVTSNEKQSVFDLGSMAHENTEDLHLQINILRKQLLLKELELLQIEQRVIKGGSYKFNATNEKEIPVYVMI